MQSSLARLSALSIAFSEWRDLTGDIGGRWRVSAGLASIYTTLFLTTGWEICTITPGASFQ